MNDTAIRDALKASQAEQLPATVHVQGAPLAGIVSRLDDASVELRVANGRARTTIRIDRIDAVTLG